MPIEPKPRTVVELFEGHPERWTKGSSARDCKGTPTPSRSDDAVCWCFLGGIMLVYEYPDAIIDRIERDFPKSLVSHWNDAPDRTFEEVLAKAKELGI